MDTKNCYKCHLIKDIEEFYVDNQRGDKHAYICKDCTRLRERDRRIIHPDTYRRKEQNYYNKYRKEIILKRKEWGEKNKHKLAAHQAVKRAIKKGILVRQACEMCGRLDVDAHHTDYSKQLDVRWLCKMHHRRVEAGDFLPERATL